MIDCVDGNEPDQNSNACFPPPDNDFAKSFQSRKTREGGQAKRRGMGGRTWSERRRMRSEGGEEEDLRRTRMDDEDKEKRRTRRDEEEKEED